MVKDSGMDRTLPEDIDKAIDRTKLAQVARRFKLDLIVLFGSHARGEARPDSDVDIAVRTLARREQRGDRWEGRLISAVEEVLGREVDFVLVDRASPFLLTEIAEDGIPVFESEPGVFAEFTWYAHRRDLDEFKIQLWERAYVYDDDTELLRWLGARTA
jgi:predicted nucleotidyltransferase